MSKFDPNSVPTFSTPGLAEAAAVIVNALASFNTGTTASAADVAASDFAYVLTKLRSFGA